MSTESWRGNEGEDYEVKSSEIISLDDTGDRR